MIFDTHAHYDAEQFDKDRKEILQNLPNYDVSLVIDPGCDGISSRSALDISEKYEYIYAAVGWHPEEWESWTQDSLQTIREMAAHPRCVAIGEIGLDYHWDKEHKGLQQEMFASQLRLALELQKPVIVHDRDSHEDCLNVVSCFPGLRGVFHCFSGSAETAKILLKDGWYLGFDGPVTYKNNKKAAEVLSVTPMDRILLETDSPYMTPVPHRGERNCSAYIPYIAEKIGEIKGMSREEVLRITMENGRRLFGI